MIILAEYDYHSVLEFMTKELKASIRVKNVKGESLAQIAYKNKSTMLVRSLLRLQDEKMCEEILKLSKEG